MRVIFGNGLSKLSPEIISTVLTIVGSLIIVTPLCGLLFQCHCNWPWSGFYFHCNFYQTETLHKCPWCNSDFAGLTSIGMALVSACLAIHQLKSSPSAYSYKNITVRIFCGMCIFILVASIGAMASAYFQNYPLGINKHFSENRS